ncbi:hypothetical protein N2W54_005813 [Lotmaria passim]
MEVRSARPPANRAVAALQSASGAVTSASPVITLSRPRHRAAPVTRYSSFDALCQAQQKTDENAALREELAHKLPQLTPRNDVAALGEQVTVRILELLNPLSADAAAFGETCRAVRESLLRASDVTSVVLVPSMVSASALATEETVRRALHSFFTARGGEVRQLVIQRVDETTTAASQAQASSPLCLPAPWMLQLVSQMPYLTELDLRHVRWNESGGSQVLQHLFSDLHIATAGTLQALRVDAETMQYWAPGWWHRHVNLRTLVVGSRCTFASTSNNDNNNSIGSISAPSSSSSSTSSAAFQLELPADYYTLMREEGRHWQLELWCPLTAHSLQQLCTAAAAAGVSFASVEELLLNVRHNERVCASAEHGGTAGAAGGGNTASAVAAGGAEATSASEAPPDARPSVKGKKAPAVVEVPEVLVTYPRLHTVTVVDVGDRPEAAAEVYQAMMALAPGLRHFNVCDTMVIGAATAAVGATAATAATAEGGRGERMKRAGGAVNNNVN